MFSKMHLECRFNKSFLMTSGNSDSDKSFTKELTLKMETSLFPWAYQLELNIYSNTQLVVYSQWCFFPSLLKTALNLIRFIWSLNKDFSVGTQGLFGSEVTNTSFCFSCP